MCGRTLCVVCTVVLVQAYSDVMTHSNVDTILSSRKNSMDITIFISLLIDLRNKHPPHPVQSRFIHVVTLSVITLTPTSLFPFLLLHRSSRVSTNH